MTPGIRIAAALLAGLAFAASAQGQGPGRPDPAQLAAAQKEALARLSYMDGVWLGTAQTTLPGGEKHVVTQTERIGPFLDGSVKVIEGRGYVESGKLTFNAFGTGSFNPATRS